MLQQIREASQEQNSELEGFDSRLQSAEQQLEQFNTQFEQQKTRVDSLINDQQDKFAQSQQQRQAEFTSFVDQRQDDFDQSKTEQKSTFETFYQQQENEGQTCIETLQKYCGHAKEIVGIIGNIGVTGNYQRIANEEKKTANLFRWIAVGCFGSMLIAVITVLILSFIFETFSWDMALFRVITALVFAAPGVYCAMESSKHRRKEQENRKIELELASISPFLEKIDNEADVQQILKQLAPQYFGNRTVENGESLLPQLDPNTLQVLKPIIELAIKAVKPL
jgi:hypothetical protein